jgi:branched-chain amino acid transport system substrate-binding protein
MHKIFISISTFVLLLAVNSNSLAEVRKISLGAALALTGNAAPFGTEELRGAQLAVSEINAKGKILLELKVEDTTSSGLGTVNAVTRLIEIDGTKIVVGPTWLDSFQGALPIAERRGVLLLTPSAGITIIKKSVEQYPLVFSSYFNFEREIRSLIEHASDSGDKKIAILFDQDPYFQAMHEFAKEAAHRRNLKITFTEDFSPGEQDFRTILQRLRKSGAESVVFGSVDEGSVLAFLRQRGQYAPKLRVLGTHDLDGYVGNQNFAGLLHGVAYVIPAEAAKHFKEAYKKMFKTDPMMSASNAYDGVMMIAAAVENGSSTPEQVSAFLRAREFQTVTFGPTRFSALGGIENGEFLIKKR